MKRRKPFIKSKTSNYLIHLRACLVERFMGEVAKRCKNKWMHWGTEGLRSILIFMLVRYTAEEVYKRFKKKYIFTIRYSVIEHSRILSHN